MYTNYHCEKVERIVRWNGFEIGSMSFNDSLRKWPDIKGSKFPLFEKSESASHGLFYSAAFINHSCMPNCGRFFIGDFMFTYALSKLQAGDELSLEYWSGLSSPTLRQKNARKYKFTCGCSLCVYQRKEAQRMSTAESFTPKVSEKIIAAQELRNRLDALQKLFGFHVVQEGLRYAFTPSNDRHIFLAGNPSTEQLASFLSVAGELYNILVDGYHRDQEFFAAAVTRAEYCLIGAHARPVISETLMATSTLEVWMLWVRCHPNDVPVNYKTLKKLWKAEAMRMFSSVFLNDERVWEYVSAAVSRPS